MKNAQYNILCSSESLAPFAACTKYICIVFVQQASGFIEKILCILCGLVWGMYVPCSSSPIRLIALFLLHSSFYFALENSINEYDC